MKNILKFSPILTMLKDDIYLHRIIEKKHFNKRAFFSSKKALFVGNVFDKIIFLDKYNRFKKIKPLKQNKYLTVIKNNNILDLSTYSSQLEENGLIKKVEFQTKKEINFKKKQKKIKNKNFIKNKIAKKNKFSLLNDKSENRVYLKRFIKEEELNDFRPQRSLKESIFNRPLKDEKSLEKNTFNSE
ncbi:MAG TPA: hypothetical protein EYG73_04865, partial [Arcobacter sp.]|nr:hypothetical protein [Arcobacter sp.]